MPKHKGRKSRHKSPKRRDGLKYGAGVDYGQVQLYDTSRHLLKEQAEFGRSKLEVSHQWDKLSPAEVDKFTPIASSIIDSGDVSLRVLTAENMLLWLKRVGDILSKAREDLDLFMSRNNKGGTPYRIITINGRDIKTMSASESAKISHNDVLSVGYEFLFHVGADSKLFTYAIPGVSLIE